MPGGFNKAALDHAGGLGPARGGSSASGSGEALIRVLHVSSSMEAAAGGPPMAVTRLAAAQAALGCAVTLATYAPPDGMATVIPGMRASPGGGRVELCLIALGGRGERFFGGGARQVLRELIPRHDIVHLAGLWEPLLNVAAGEARRAGVPYAVAPHGMLDPWALSQKRLKKQLAWAARVKGMANGAAFIHVLNRAERKRMAPMNLTPPAEIIPNGIFLEDFEGMPPPDEFHEQHPELRGEPYVFFLGRLHVVKGLDVLAEAFARVVERHRRPIRLVVAGPDGGYRAEFERRVRELGVAERVHLVGALWGREKMAALAGAIAYCQPSRQEGFSVSITEALASGLPCVVSEECRYPEVAEVGAGQVVELTSDAVAQGLLAVLGYPDRAGMGALGKALVSAAYTWPIVARRSIEVYVRYVAAAGNGSGVHSNETREIGTA